MSVLKVNETPVRTSKNFKINNIKLENVELSENVQTFNGVTINGDAKIENNIEISDLKYGLGNELLDNIKNFSNSKFRIKPQKDVQIKYNLSEQNPYLISYMEIVANEDTNIIVEFSSHDNFKCFVNGIIKVFASENTNVNIVVANLLNENTNFFLSMQNELDSNSNLKYTVIDFGAQNSIQNYYSNIAGELADNSLESIYLGGNTQIKDINYIAELYGKKSNISIDVQGALKDTAKKNFKGTIDFKNGCKNAKGEENEYCMLLSDKAKSLALPMLLCTEDDVEGNHSAASGKLDDEELFYIMSRGIEKKDATKLIVKAHFNKMIERITNEKFKNMIIEEIDRRLD